MTAPLRDQVAEVCLAHFDTQDVRSGVGLSKCSCGDWLEVGPMTSDGFCKDEHQPEAAHAAHLADLITALVEQREREVRAEALRSFVESLKPYREELTELNGIRRDDPIEWDAVVREFGKTIRGGTDD